MRRQPYTLAMNPIIFTIHSDGLDRTGLVTLAEHYVNQLWVPTHLTQVPRISGRPLQAGHGGIRLEMLEVLLA